MQTPKIFSADVFFQQPTDRSVEFKDAKVQFGMIIRVSFSSRTVFLLKEGSRVVHSIRSFILR